MQTFKGCGGTSRKGYEMVVEVFLLIAYVAGTYMGWRISRVPSERIVAETIDKLIQDGYIQTQQGLEDVELLKYWETPKGVDSKAE